VADCVQLIMQHLRCIIISTNEKEFPLVRILFPRLKNYFACACFGFLNCWRLRSLGCGRRLSPVDTDGIPKLTSQSRRGPPGHWPRPARVAGRRFETLPQILATTDERDALTLDAPQSCLCLSGRCPPLHRWVQRWCCFLRCPARLFGFQTVSTEATGAGMTGQTIV